MKLLWTSLLALWNAISLLRFLAWVLLGGAAWLTGCHSGRYGHGLHGSPTRAGWILAMAIGGVILLAVTTKEDKDA